MNGNSLGVALSSGGLAAAERSEGSPPGEPQRSGAAAKASADSGAASRPDPEVVAKAKRRTYTAEYKQRILRRSRSGCGDTRWSWCSASSERSVLVAVGHLAARTGQRHPRGVDPQRRGPKSKRNPLEEEIQKLHRQVGQLTEKLRKAEIIIDVQKKVAALLGRPIPEPDPEENS